MNTTASKQSRGHSKRSKHKKRKFKLSYLVRWSKKNPIKVIAFIFFFLLIYITYLFIHYAATHKRKMLEADLKVVYPNSVYSVSVKAARFL